MPKPLKIIAHGQTVVLSSKTISATREWYADNARICMAEALSGTARVNDLNRYIEWQERTIAETLAGRWDHTIAFVQRAYLIQTGECVPLLP